MFVYGNFCFCFFVFDVFVEFFLLKVFVCCGIDMMLVWELILGLYFGE